MLQLVASLRSVQEVEQILRFEKPRHHDDEDVELEEFDEVEAEIDDLSEQDFGDNEEEDYASVTVPEWSRRLEDGPPKLTPGELEEVDSQSREVEIERLLRMKVLKELPEGADTSQYKFLSTRVVYDWRHREDKWKKTWKTCRP